MKDFTPWSEAHLAILHEVAANGGSQAQVAEQTGRSIASVESKMRRLKLSMPRNVGPLRAAPEQQSAPIVVVPSRNTANLTAFLLGDPPVGRSALDLRSAA